MSTRGTLPPTPPMQSDSQYDGRQSPSTASNSGYSVASAPGYYYPPPPSSTISNVEPQPQRQHSQPMPQRRVSGHQMGYAQQQAPFAGPQYAVGPGPQQMSSYYPNPMQQAPPQSQISGLYYQRPLPQVSTSTYQSILKQRLKQFSSLLHLSCQFQ